LAPTGRGRDAPTARVAQGIRVQARSAHPDHSPGSTSLYAPELRTVFTGDTLFNGGPGATGRSHSSFDTIIEVIWTSLRRHDRPDEPIAGGH
jgi:glyoxylase-like metal-dependent hydrolase (beta-lactamase superfamily II)